MDVSVPEAASHLHCSISEELMQQETPFGLEIPQENRMRIHAAAGNSRRMMDGLVLVLRIGMRVFQSFPWASNSY